MSAATLALIAPVYRQRNQIERLINRLKQSRRIASCYEKCAVNYHAMLTIGMISFGCDLL
jgi:transposase